MTIYNLECGDCQTNVSSMTIHVYARQGSALVGERPSHYAAWWKTKRGTNHRTWVRGGGHSAAY